MSENFTPRQVDALRELIRREHIESALWPFNVWASNEKLYAGMQAMAWCPECGRWQLCSDGVCPEGHSVIVSHSKNARQ